MKPYVLGIDIGGTNTVFGIVDARGVVIASSSIKTLKHADVKDYIDELYENVMRLLEANDAVEKIHGIGIGAPNANYYTGMIEKLVNIPWPTPLPFAQMVSEKFGIPVAITNDANAAAIGEMTYGAARGMKNFIMITLGTGVGSGIVINGQLVYGHDGFAGELGHTSATTAACVAVVAPDVWRHTVLLQEWHVQRVSSLRCAESRQLSAIYQWSPSRQRMSMMRPSTVTGSPLRYSNIPEIFLARRLPISLCSPHLRLSSCSAVLPNLAIFLCVR